jgi:lysophospholipase L1-like esterase
LRNRRGDALRSRTVVAAVAGVAGVVAVLSLAAAPAPAVSGPGGHHPLVLGLGDSALTNQGCDCSDFLVRYAELAARRTGHDVQARNEAQSGASSNDLLTALRSRRLLQEVATADVVVVFVGANDFYDAFGRVAGGGSAQQQYGPIADQVRDNVATAIRTVRGSNPQARVVVCGYWNDFKAGSVARQEYSAAQRRAADRATDFTNHALYTAAERAGVHYESTRKLFDHQRDITPYLAKDGDHLSAAGHRLIAKDLLDLLRPSSANPPGRPNPKPASVPRKAPAVAAQPSRAPSPPAPAPSSPPVPAPMPTPTPTPTPAAPGWPPPLPLPPLFRVLGAENI